MPFEYKPPEYRPSEYKPLKMCLKMAVSPGLIFGILRYMYNSTISTLYIIRLVSVTDEYFYGSAICWQVLLLHRFYIEIISIHKEFYCYFHQLIFWIRVDEICRSMSFYFWCLVLFCFFIFFLLEIELMGVRDSLYFIV